MSALFLVAFVVALLASVALHEAGHLLTAKHLGMKVREYFVGFGPRLWSFRRGETEYGVKLVPAGGYVKIVGMTQLEELEPGEDERAFWRFPAPARTVVLSAGSITHFVIAVVLVVVALAIGGDLSNPYPSTTLQSVLTCVPAGNATSCPAHVAPAARSPASRSGLRPGDRVTAVDATLVGSWNQLTTDLQGRAGKRTRITVVRDGATSTVTLVPAPKVERAADGRRETVGFIGISPTEAYPHYAPAALLHHSVDTLGLFVTGTVSGLIHLPSHVAALAENKPRTGNGPAGVVDIGRISYDIGGSSATFAQKLDSFLLIIAELNFFVGVFNLLPLLPLDGGHIAILVFEAVRSRLARLLRRPDPGRVDITKVLPLAYAVIVLFVGVSLLLVYAGIANPIRLQ